ncbi:MAG: hypothetical protein WAN36_07080 [Calditrichia bacterium]
MGNKYFDLQKQAQELESLGMEIDELKAFIYVEEAESSGNRTDYIKELHLKQEKLIRIFLSMKETKS